MHGITLSMATCEPHVNPAAFLTARLLLLNVDLQHRLAKKAPLELLTFEGAACLSQAALWNCRFPLSEDLAAPLMHQPEVLSCTSHGSTGDVEPVIPPGKPLPSAPCWHSVL